jgi:hypothetical protein
MQYPIAISKHASPASQMIDVPMGLGCPAAEMPPQARSQPTWTTSAAQVDIIPSREEGFSQATHVESDRLMQDQQ